MPITRSTAQPALIESGRILDVDLDSYTVSITTQFTKKPQSGVSFATPYQHYSEGEGIYFMPEVGSLCWVCFPSDGSRPFVLAWAAASEEGNFRANKVDLNPGDIYLGTRDGNAMTLRRGGVIQISAGPLAQRLFLPVNNTIKDICENYSLLTIGGSLEWSIKRPEATTDGNRPASLKLHAREFADDAKPIAELEIGSHEGNENLILSLSVKASGASGAEQVISLKITKEGDITWTVANNLVMSVAGIIDISSESDITIASDAEARLQGNTTVVGADNLLQVKSARGAVEVTAATLIDLKSTTRVADGTTPVLLASPTFIAWLLGHIHGSAVGPTTPPTAPILMSDHISKKLFSQ